MTAHGTAVLRVCRALVGLQDAEDVWQETFLAALRAYPSTEVLNYQAWLVSIARNKAMDHHRTAGRLPIPASSPLSGPDGVDDVAHAVVSGEDAAMVWAALGLLPKKQREAVVYHHLAGLRHAEVAELLGNSEAAARRAAADGMKGLRKLLAGPATSEGDGK